MNIHELSWVNASVNIDNCHRGGVIWILSVRLISLIPTKLWSVVCGSFRKSHRFLFVASSAIFVLSSNGVCTCIRTCIYIYVHVNVKFGWSVLPRAQCSFKCAQNAIFVIYCASIMCFNWVLMHNKSRVLYVYLCFNCMSQVNCPLWSELETNQWS